MEKFKVVFKGAMIPALREVFKAEAPQDVEVVILGSEPMDEAEISRVSDADFLVVHKAGPSLPQIVEKSEKLKLIQTLSQGTDHLPMSQAAVKRIPVSNAGGITAISVAEHTLLLMLATLKSLSASIEAIRKEKPQMEINVENVHRLHNKTIGIVGLGNIGRWVAKLVLGFGANVIFSDTTDVPESTKTELEARQVSLDELLSSADVVTLHVPNLESTKKMIGWKQLSMMKPTAILVNTSRGTVVDESMLLRSLEEKRIAGAGLDVLEKEPPNPDNHLLHMNNVVVTPHIAAEAWEDYVLLFKLTWENVSLVRAGKEPRNLVTPRYV